MLSRAPIASIMLLSSAHSFAQQPPPPDRVEVKSIAADEAISRRLEQVLLSTGWYVAPQVRVQQYGVVFLSGQAAEAGLSSEARVIEHQDRQIEPLEQQENLLRDQ